ncbi:MAG: L-histidine N(alpha)-methyltransferase, partial [Bacteroidota bacterium]
MSNLNGTTTSEAVLSAFALDVLNGLQSEPKSLPSKYFYDEKGDKIFQEIMEMDEYYLTRAEHSIFKEQKEEIFEALDINGKAFRLLELGAGDGLKTRVLLEYFASTGVPFDYSPVDISPHVLEICEQKVRKEIPGLSITPLAGDYFDVLSSINYDTSKRNVVLFLGSTIGNFTNAQAIEFLRRLRGHLHGDDYLLVGFDLRKDPDMILSAYHDKAGVTKRFNLNLLERINRE